MGTDTCCGSDGIETSNGVAAMRGSRIWHRAHQELHKNWLCRWYLTDRPEIGEGKKGRAKCQFLDGGSDEDSD
jgi:hypothetical protein